MPRDFRAALAASRTKPFKISGDTGDSGDTGLTPEGNPEFPAVTTAESELLTVVTAPVAGTDVTTSPDAMVPPSGDTNNDSNQRVTDTVTSVTTGNAEVEERAAIMEYEAGMPRAWADAFAKIVHGPNRFADYPARWQSVVDGALVFADQWAGKAHSLGWTVDELFGLDPVAPAARLDHRGLAFLLGNGSRVVAIDRDGADIITGQGSRQRYYRQRARAA